ncbi:MAG TPA: hypothetical protein DDW30_00755 [Clostridiales bacterium]|nr:hypothetical protein [Clostridiales bacterium]
MQMKKRIRKIIPFLLLAALLLGLLPSVAAAGEDEVYMETYPFENAGESNFRIPAMLATNAGKLFAFCNDRRKSVSDNAEIQWLCYAVSEDGGESFSEVRYLLCEEGWTYIIGAPVYDAVHDNILLFYQAYLRTDAARQAYAVLTDEEKAKKPTGNAILESADGGNTWTSRAVNMPKALVTPGTVISTHGASTGIQLKNGEHAGRLVVAGKAGSGTLDSKRQKNWQLVGCLIYSDDYGKTWKSSLNAMPMGTDETSVCELSDGTLYISSRTILNACGRTVAYSRDGGRSLRDFRFDRSLEVQLGDGVHGGLATVPNYDGKGNTLTLFTSLNSTSPFRRNLCIWASFDEGKTWSKKTVIYPKLASYAELCYNPATGLISVMYEYGIANCYANGIRILTVSVDWLLENATDNVSLRDEEPLTGTLTPQITEASLLLQLNGDGAEGIANGIWYNSIGAANGTVAKGAGVTVGKTTLNGETVLSFDGTGGVSVSGLGTLTGDTTYFIVYRSAAESYIGGKEQSLFRSTHAGGIFSSFKPAFDALCTTVQGGYYVPAEEFVDTEWHIVAVTWHGENEADAVLTQFTDGNLTRNFEVGYLAARHGSTAGVQTIAPDLACDVAEVLVWNRCLSDREVAETGLALAEKYGLTWTARAADAEDNDSDDNNGKGNGETESRGQETESRPETKAAPSKDAGCASTVAGVPCAAVLAFAALGAERFRRKRGKEKK